VNRHACRGRFIPLESEMRLILGLALLIFGTTAAVAVRPDECEQQRAQYPKNWADVSHEQALFDCSSHYSGGIRVKIGASDSRGRALFSLVPLTQGGTGPVGDTTKRGCRISAKKISQLRSVRLGCSADGRYVLEGGIVRGLVAKPARSAPGGNSISAGSIRGREGCLSTRCCPL